MWLLERFVIPLILRFTYSHLERRDPTYTLDTVSIVLWKCALLILPSAERQRFGDEWFVYLCEIESPFARILQAASFFVASTNITTQLLTLSFRKSANSFHPSRFYARCTEGYRSGRGDHSINGVWLDSNGISSRFWDGSFETRTTDTNTLLATGKFTLINPRLVQIDIRSLVTQTNSRINCFLVSPSMLNCTTSEGNQFSLTRQVDFV